MPDTRNTNRRALVEIIRRSFALSVTRPFALFLFSGSLLFSGCFTAPTMILDSFRKASLTDWSIDIPYPADWYVVKDNYFHFKAIGFGPNHLPATIEYKGAEYEGHQNKTDLYAEGWYEAIGKSYPDFKYDFKRKVTENPEPMYEFEGTYRVATDTYRKLGKLVFRGKRVHAIYYTGMDMDFQPVRELFNNLFARIQYGNNGK